MRWSTTSSSAPAGPSRCARMPPAASRSSRREREIEESHPAHPRHRLRRAADAPGVRLRHPRLRLRAGRRRDRRPDRLRGAGLAAPLGAAHRGPGRRRELRRGRATSRSTSTSATPIRASNDPPQPRLPVLRDPRGGLTDGRCQVPNLDDRRFQDLVDDAKRLVQQRCPEWTDHNVSDPGVTLIEAFAWMTDQLLYRLNRVPDRHYVKFLELIGVRLFPPTAAPRDVTFWLSAPQPETVRDRRPAPRSRPSRTRRPTRPSSSPRPATCPSSPRRTSATLSSLGRRQPYRRHDDDRWPWQRASSASTPRPSPATLLLVGPRRGGAVMRRAPPLQLPHRGRGRRSRRSRRWPGRPGPATAGQPARSTPTRPAASTATAT